jgi:hypothetical protein
MRDESRARVIGDVDQVERGLVDEILVTGDATYVWPITPRANLASVFIVSPDRNADSRRASPACTVLGRGREPRAAEFAMPLRKAI